MSSSLGRYTTAYKFFCNQAKPILEVERTCPRMCAHFSSKIKSLLSWVYRNLSPKFYQNRLTRFCVIVVNRIWSQNVRARERVRVLTPKLNELDIGSIYNCLQILFKSISKILCNYAKSNLERVSVLTQKIK